MYIWSNLLLVPLQILIIVRASINRCQVSCMNCQASSDGHYMSNSDNLAGRVIGFLMGPPSLPLSIGLCSTVRSTVKIPLDFICAIMQLYSLSDQVFCHSTCLSFSSRQYTGSLALLSHDLGYPQGA